jgi:hypothetical protein
LPTGCVQEVPMILKINSKISPGTINHLVCVYVWNQRSSCRVKNLISLLSAVPVHKMWLFCFYITLHFLPWEPFVTWQQPKEILLCNNYGRVEYLPWTCLVRLAPQMRVPGLMVSIWRAAVSSNFGIKTRGAFSWPAWWAQLRKTVRLHDGF